MTKPPSLIRVFAVRMKKAWVQAHSECEDSDQTWAELSLRWAHGHFVGFVMSRFIYFLRLLTFFGYYDNLHFSLTFNGKNDK